MKNTLAILSVLGLAACGDSATTTAPEVFSPIASVAVTTFASNKPVLFVQAVDGTQKKRINFTNIRDEIPGNFAGLTVSDGNLLALGNPSWDPTGTGRVAVVATIAYDQSEIVVMRTDGSGGDVASINTQIIAGTPEWSPDGKKLAYIMATLPGLKGLDLFITDLTTHTVKRLTTNANLTNATVRWSLDGQSIYYTKVTGPSAGTDHINDIVKINATTGASETVATGISGQISSISRTGARVLLTRGFGVSRSLIEHDLSGTERTLAADVTFGRYSTIESSALVITAAIASGGVTTSFQLLDLGNKKLTTLVGISGESNADVWTAYPID